MKGDLDRRLSALAEAVTLAGGRLDEDVVAPARAVVARAGRRLGLGVESTVVALAGPTGSGKSSLFNALAGSDLVAAGRRRPTTGTATAAVWGDGAGDLLDWLDVRRRHRLADSALDGLVLIDLPDFDSVEVAHRMEVDRLIELVDLLVWVVDPQKYADASLHERYLRRLTGYDGAMVVVLNQADLLPQAELRAARADLERVLDDDGLSRIPLVALSAQTHEGLDQLARVLRDRVRSREAAVARLSADVTNVGAALGAGCVQDAGGGVRRSDRQRLVAALSEAAGVATVVLAVGRAHRRRGALATGWPFVRWLRRFRPDPLRRLRLPDRPDEAGRTSLAGPSRVQQAQVAAASRALAASAAETLPAPWPALARTAATSAEDEVADRLDRAVAGADLHTRRPLWWRPAGVLQTLLAAATLVGALWLVALAVLGYLQLDDVLPLPEVGDVALPTVLLLGGALAGLVLGLLTRLVNGLGARRRARAAARSLRKRVEAVADDLVIRPVEGELDAYQRFCRAVREAGGK